MMTPRKSSASSSSRICKKFSVAGSSLMFFIAVVVGILVFLLLR